MSSSPSPDIPESYTLTVKFSVHAGREDDFIRAGQDIMAKVIQEKECLSFDFQQDAFDPTLFYVTERWQCTLDHIMNVQLKRDYYEPYVKEVEPMWSKPREFNIGRTRSIYQA